jgi:hypothetical protein
MKTAASFMKTGMVRRRGVVSAAVTAVMLLVPASMASAGTSPGTDPPNANVSARSTAKWWQWDLSIPVSDNPAFDATGQHCGVGQSGPVFFLAGMASGAAVTRNDCTVPAHKKLLFPVINTECSNVEAPPFFGRTPKQRRDCAEGTIDDVGLDTLRASIDGVALPELDDSRVQSPDFKFIMPAADNILGLPGVTSGRSSSNGYWLLLEPLSPGSHVIHFEAAIVSGPFVGYSQNVTYNLTVAR